MELPFYSENFALIINELLLEFYIIYWMVSIILKLCLFWYICLPLPYYTTAKK